MKNNHASGKTRNNSLGTFKSQLEKLNLLLKKLNRLYNKYLKGEQREKGEIQILRRYKSSRKKKGGERTHST